MEWLFTDTGSEEISEDYFVNRIKQYDLYLGYSMMTTRGFVFIKNNLIVLKYKKKNHAICLYEIR